MNKIRKLHSKNYDKVIEVQVPVRFYWVKDEYDGFEFGSLVDCSRYQLRLLDQVIKQLAFEHNCTIVAEYMREKHKDQWMQILDMIDAESLNIPQAFFDAFKDDSE